jgi:hypothetical protein
MQQLTSYLQNLCHWLIHLIYDDTAFCDIVCQWLATGRWLTPGTDDILCCAQIYGTELLPPPFFFYFLFAYLFSIKFLYCLNSLSFIYHVGVLIAIQSYCNNNGPICRPYIFLLNATSFYGENAQALVARTYHPPFFSNFLFTNLFSIKFLY